MGLLKIENFSPLFITIFNLGWVGNQKGKK